MCRSQRYLFARVFGHTHIVVARSAKEKNLQLWVQENVLCASDVELTVVSGVDQHKAVEKTISRYEALTQGVGA